MTYTGNSAANQTVGHGLGVAPSMIIAKQRTSSGTNWVVYHKSLGYGNVLIFTTSAAITIAEYWGSAAPTSTVFGVKGGGYDNNTNGASMVAYCFAPIAGYSAFGSYTGNGSADGPFVFTGFRPALVIIKRSDGGYNDWYMLDTKRNTYNVMSLVLRPSASTAEQEYNPLLDTLSNGFKIRDSSGSWNTSTGTHVYAAFAESPFKYSLAR